jgi:uncharacterized protein YjiS (DUF1127 family)
MSELHWSDHGHHSQASHSDAGLLALIGEWAHRIESRRELAGLSDQALRDIGITRVDAINEASKPFWRA